MNVVFKTNVNVHNSITQSFHIIFKADIQEQQVFNSVLSSVDMMLVKFPSQN
jgi:hypothetical protein